MCGICGWYSLDASPIDGVIVREMAKCLVHRGPDDSGFYFNNSIALAQRRLSIIDLAGGHQPLSNEDKTVWITYNGEIYNYRELMKELSNLGHIFRTQSDTEVIVHAYEEYGLNFMNRLNGMYAFAIWDSRNKRLLLARDPFGVKPLYIWANSHQLLFASEIKAFLAHPDFRRELDPIGLDQYLTLQFVPSPRTIFKDVQKLSAGHYMIVENNHWQEKPFALHQPSKWQVTTEIEAVESLRELLSTAVKRQMVSDVPVGALLSGGVDSATIVALMQKISNVPIKTFTVGFDGNFEKNELKSARRTAEILGTEHHEIIISIQDILNSFSETVWHLDEPIATDSSLPMYWLCKCAAEHVKVVLTGQGADEPWAGYRRYRGEKIGRWYRMMPRFVRHRLLDPLVESVPRFEGLKRAIFSQEDANPIKRFANVYTVFTSKMKKALYRNGMALPAIDNDIIERLRYLQSFVQHLDTLTQQLYIESRFSLSDNLLMYGDKISMAASLEARVPFLDIELIDFVESLPIELRLKGFMGHKYLFRKAIAPWLSPEIINRPKIGFKTPIDEWFQKKLTHYLKERITCPGSICSNYFNINFINKLIHNHEYRLENNTRPLFTLLVFEEWYRKFMTTGEAA
jgi:asparagine synthase (glutamine-hydrolysing)